MRLMHRRPSPAMVVATLAFFVALGDGAWAVARLPANSVGTKQLKKAAVTTPKLANGAVTGAKVASQTLTGTQINASTLGKVQSATHADNSDRFDHWATTYFLGHTLTVAASKTVNPGSHKDYILCPSGYEVTGGGAYASGSVSMLDSTPAVNGVPLANGEGDPANSWLTTVNNQTGAPVLVQWEAVCVKSGPGYRY